MMPTSTPSVLSESARSTSSSSKKRSRDDDDVVLSPEALAHMSRSERKRHREKKRRNDVNKGFDDLMDLLVEIDPVVRAEHEDRSRRGAVSDDHVLSRVELISRTVEVLRRVHKENEERKLIIQQLLQKPNTTAASASLDLLNKQAGLSSHDSLARQQLSGYAGLRAEHPPSILSSTTAPMYQQRVFGGSVGTLLPGDLQVLTSLQALSKPPVAYSGGSFRFINGSLSTMNDPTHHHQQQQHHHHQQQRHLSHNY